MQVVRYWTNRNGNIHIYISRTPKNTTSRNSYSLLNFSAIFPCAPCQPGKPKPQFRRAYFSYTYNYTICAKWVAVSTVELELSPKACRLSSLVVINHFHSEGLRVSMLLQIICGDCCIIASNWANTAVRVGFSRKRGDPRWKVRAT